MGFALNSPNGGPYKRVGGYPSQNALCAILFAGYAAGNHPESKRVRRWVRSVYKWEDKSAPDTIPDKFNTTRKVDDLKTLLAFRHNNCHWVTFETNGLNKGQTRSMDRGLKLKIPTCPILAGLVILYTRIVVADPFEDIPAAEVPAVRDAITAVLPNLSECVWHADVKEVLAVFEDAAAKKQHVRAS